MNSLNLYNNSQNIIDNRSPKEYEKVTFTNGISTYKYITDLHQLNFIASANDLDLSIQSQFEKAESIYNSK